MDIRSIFFLFYVLISCVVQAQDFYTGVDLSYVNELEDCGAAYSNRLGVSADPYAILKEEGANLVRLRLWHDPQWTNYSNLTDVKVSIARAKAEGMKVMLDFHYSDFWADPGRQWRPGAWEEVTDDAILEDSVYNYTEKVLTELNDLDLLPEFVQIGNETNGNILIPRNGAALDSGSPDLYPMNWSRQVGLLQKGIDAVNDLNQTLNVNMQTIIHVANLIDAASWFPLAISNGLSNFDIIGLSYYPQWHDLGVRQVGDYVATLKTEHNKEVMIVETGYPWTTDNAGDNANNVLGYESRLFTYSNTFSIETQKDFLIELSWLVKENGGLGVVYWEPAWISTSCQTYWATGSHWDNATLTDFDGKLHEGADFLSYDYSQKPEALEDQQVTFKVDMTNIDTENGVFVTGDFTGETWALQPMTLTENNLYALETTIPGRTTGAYIFYNDNEWEDENREVVPAPCANLWDTHREYRVKGADETIHFSWGRCDQQPNDVILGLDGDLTELSLYPTMAKEKISIGGGRNILNLELLDVSGKKFSLISAGSNDYRVDHLITGLYLIRATTSSGMHVFRFIKQ